MPRETSVKRSAVSRSPIVLASSMACRTDFPNAARAVDRASTWLSPSVRDALGIQARLYPSPRCVRFLGDAA